MIPTPREEEIDLIFEFVVDAMDSTGCLESSGTAETLCSNLYDEGISRYEAIRSIREIVRTVKGMGGPLSDFSPIVLAVLNRLELDKETLEFMGIAEFKFWRMKALEADKAQIAMLDEVPDLAKFFDPFEPMPDRS